jgi:hypothetical protein
VTKMTVAWASPSQTKNLRAMGLQEETHMTKTVNQEELLKEEKWSLMQVLRV